MLVYQKWLGERQGLQAGGVLLMRTIFQLKFLTAGSKFNGQAASNCPR